MPSWLIGIAIPVSAILSIIRLLEYEFKWKGNKEEY